MAGHRVTTQKPARLREKGATLVEMAMVFPLLILVVIGITEIGVYFKDYLAVSYASREGARIGAFVGSTSDADCQILVGIGGILSNQDLNRLERVEIFLASQGGDQLDTNIVTYNGGDPLACHEPAEVTDGWTRNTTGWPASARQTVVGNGPLDIIGVRLIMEREWITNFPPFSGSTDINESTLTRIEPEAFQ